MPRLPVVPWIVRRCAPAALMLLVVAVIYRGWFELGPITAGDWGFYTTSRVLDFWPIPSIWDAARGQGGMSILAGPIYPLVAFAGLCANLGIPFAQSERLIWMFPAIFVGSLGGYIYAYSLFHSRLAAFVSGLFVVANSYVFIIYGGGQFTVAVAYAFAPLILWSFRAALYTGQSYRYVLTGLFLAIQAMYDTRLTYLTVWMLLLYVPFIAADRSRTGSYLRLAARLIAQGAVAIVIGLLVHAPWLLLAVLVKSAAVPTGYGGVGWVGLLSFMRLENGIGLLHPFWPLNQLGHTIPFDPVFYGISLLVFALLARRRPGSDVLYLYAMSLIAVFLVKGENPPASQVYDWLFAHIPGFAFFREPSKFYLPIMVSSGALLGLLATTGVSWLRTHALPRMVTGSAGAAWAALCIGAALYPSGPVLFQNGQTYAAQTFQPRPVPADFVHLNNLIDGQHEYFRTLWWPAYERYGASSELHPAIEAGFGQYYFGAPVSTTNWPSWLRAPNALHVLQELSIKYVIIPTDPYQEIYNPSSTQQNAISEARRDLHGFQEMTFGAIHVFRTPRYLPEAYAAAQVRVIHHKLLPGQEAMSPLVIHPANGTTPTMLAADVQATPASASLAHLAAYTVSSRNIPLIQVRHPIAGQLELDVRDAQTPFLAVFLQNYDPEWQAYVLPAGASPSWWTLWHTQPLPESDHLHADNYANAWRVTTKGSYTLVLAYRPQGIFAVGWVACWGTIVCCISYVLLAAFATWRRTSKLTTPATAVSQALSA